MQSERSTPELHPRPTTQFILLHNIFFQNIGLSTEDSPDIMSLRSLPRDFAHKKDLPVTSYAANFSYKMS